MSGAVVTVATAVVGRWESPLVAGLEGEPGLQVVRRCADVAELLGCVASGLAQAVVVSADLRGVDAEVLERLALQGCAVVALTEPSDDGAATRLHRLGVVEVHSCDSPARDVAQAVREAVQRTLSPRGAGSSAPQSPGAAVDPALGWGDPRAALPTARRFGEPAWVAGPTVQGDGEGPFGAQAAAAEDAPPVVAPPSGNGRPGGVVAVWGPTGAPGRTTIATGLAAELAAGGSSTLLVDADTYGASVAQVIGLLDEVAGLAGACRAADRGLLDLRELSRHAPLVADHLRVLTGLVRADRWPEVRAGAVMQVLAAARDLCAWTVVDTGFCLEQDEELAYDTAAPRRNQATLAALAEADVVVAVGGADPVGLQRLVRGLRDLGEVTSAARVVVANRVRAAAVGSPPQRRVRAALERYAGVTDPVLVPDDAAAVDAAVLAGRTLVEHARSSPVRQGLRDLVLRLQQSTVTARPLPVGAGSAPAP